MQNPIKCPHCNSTLSIRAEVDQNKIYDALYPDHTKYKQVATQIARVIAQSDIVKLRIEVGK